MYAYGSLNLLYANDNQFKVKSPENNETILITRSYSSLFRSPGPTWSQLNDNVISVKSVMPIKQHFAFVIPNPLKCHPRNVLSGIWV